MRKAAGAPFRRAREYTRICPASGGGSPGSHGALVSATGPIAVTGATGFVGRAVLDEAAARGLEVRALTRRPQEPLAGVEWVRGDLSARPALEALVDGASAVIHVAGVVNTPDPSVFEAGNALGTRSVVGA